MMMMLELGILWVYGNPLLLVLLRRRFRLRRFRSRRFRGLLGLMKRPLLERERERERVDRNEDFKF